MFKSTKLLALAGLATVAAGVATPAFAATDSLQGSTDLVYDGGSTVIESDAGWAMSIPTTIHFSNKNPEQKGNVTLQSAKSFGPLTETFATLTVDTTVTTKNNYTLKGKDVNGADREAGYTYTLGGQDVKTQGVAQFNLTQVDPATGTQVQQGTYKLVDRIGVQGTYTDTMTYNFKGTYTYK